MSKTTLVRGLLLILVLVWIGACSSRVPSVQPPRLPDVPTENICNWPDYCHPNSARDMLDQITQLVPPAGEIDALLRERLADAIQRAKSPDLRNAENRHVCHLQDPLPCDELREILEHAKDPVYGADPMPPQNPKEADQPVEEQPASTPGHWETIAQELEGFPTGK